MMIHSSLIRSATPTQFSSLTYGSDWCELVLKTPISLAIKTSTLRNKQKVCKLLHPSFHSLLFFNYPQPNVPLEFIIQGTRNTLLKLEFTFF